MSLDAESLYHVLRDAAESAGATIGDHADDLLAQAAEAMVSDTENVLSLTGDSNERYSMYSPAGNAYVAECVRPFLDAIQQEEFKRSELVRRYNELMQKITARFPEVNDTEPRGAIQDEVDAACKKVGWSGLIDEW